MKQADYDVANQDINIQYTKNQKLPILEITGSYTQSGLGGTQTVRSGFGQGTAIIQVVPGGVTDVFGQLFGFSYTGYTAAFNLQIPLTSRGLRPRSPGLPEDGAGRSPVKWSPSLKMKCS